MSEENSNFCLFCFENIPTGQSVCPHCGHSVDEPQSSIQQLPRGTILDGQYLLGQALGQGGFGITYLAFDLNLHTRRAIKEYFPRGLVTRQGLKVTAVTAVDKDNFQKGVEAFYKEAQAVTRFGSHPNVIQINAFFRENGTAYFVMEYVDGIPLSEYLKQRGGTLAYEEALRLLLPIADALSELHTVNLLHRDVKPDNIYITKRGQPKLLDFGSARFETSVQTRNSAIVITPGYAPPEQYSKRSGQGTFTDVYALAATFYHVLTGIVPPEATDRMLEDELIPIENTGITIPPQAAAAIDHALRIKREERIQSISQFCTDLCQPDKATASMNSYKAAQVRAETDQVIVEGSMATRNKHEKEKWLFSLAGLALCAASALLILRYFSSQKTAEPDKINRRETSRIIQLTVDRLSTESVWDNLTQTAAAWILTPTSTQKPTETSIPTLTAMVTRKIVLSPTSLPTAVIIPSNTDLPIPMIIVTDTLSPSPTPTPTQKPTSTFLPTKTSTLTPLPTHTLRPTNTSTFTPIPGSTPEPTMTTIPSNMPTEIPYHKLIAGPQETFHTLYEALDSLPSNAGDVHISLSGDISEQQDLQIPLHKGVHSLTIEADTPITVNYGDFSLFANGIPLTISEHVSLINSYIFGGASAENGEDKEIQSSQITVNGSAGFIYGGGKAVGNGSVSRVGRSKITITGSIQKNLRAGGYAYQGGQTHVSESRLTLADTAKVQGHVYSTGYAAGSIIQSEEKSTCYIDRKTCMNNNGYYNCVQAEDGRYCALPKVRQNVLGQSASFVKKTVLDLQGTVTGYIFLENQLTTEGNMYVEQVISEDGSLKSDVDGIIVGKKGIVPVTVSAGYKYDGLKGKPIYDDLGKAFSAAESGPLTIRVKDSFIQTDTVSIPDDKGITSVTIEPYDPGVPVVINFDQNGFFASGIPLVISKNVTLANVFLYGGKFAVNGEQFSVPRSLIVVHGSVENIYGGGKSLGSGSRSEVDEAYIYIDGQVRNSVHAGPFSESSSYSRVGSAFFLLDEGGSIRNRFYCPGYAYGIVNVNANQCTRDYNSCVQKFGKCAESMEKSGIDNCNCHYKVYCSINDLSSVASALSETGSVTRDIRGKIEGEIIQEASSKDGGNVSIGEIQEKDLSATFASLLPVEGKPSGSSENTPQPFEQLNDPPVEEASAKTTEEKTIIIENPNDIGTILYEMNYISSYYVMKTLKNGEIVVLLDISTAHEWDKSAGESVEVPVFKVRTSDGYEGFIRQSAAKVQPTPTEEQASVEADK